MMKEIKCTVIQDLLPLYAGEVVSQDTKEMVGEHLQYCDKCQKEYGLMKQKLYLPIENQVSLFQKINKKWRKKKVIISMVSIFATAITILGAYLFVFYHESVIPYSEDLMKIEKQHHLLVSKYFGKSYATVHATEPIPLKIDGEEKNISFIYYTKTIAHSHSINLIHNEKGQNEQVYIFPLTEIEKVDAVYYVDYDMKNILEKKKNLGIRFYNAPN